MKMNRAERRRLGKLERQQNKKLRKQKVPQNDGFLIAEGMASPFPQIQTPKAFLIDGAFYLITPSPYIDDKIISTWESDRWEFAISKVQGQLGFYTKTDELYSEYLININYERKNTQDEFLKPIPPDGSFPFIICLVDVNTNVVKSFRMFGLSNQLCCEIQKIFREQIKRRTQTNVNYGILDSVQDTFNNAYIKEKAAA